VTDENWLTADELSAWRAFIGTTRLLDSALDRQLVRDAGMPHTYYGVLVALSEQAEGRRRLSDLAAMVDFSQSRLTHAIARMEAQGWVRREQRPSSGREKDAVLTDAGRAALAAAAPGHVARVRELVFDRLSPEQVEQLAAICSQLLPGLLADAGESGAVAMPYSITH
jgi:DNA-binding MarR family transcriptional regulator